MRKKQLHLSHNPIWCILRDIGFYHPNFLFLFMLPAAPHTPSTSSIRDHILRIKTLTKAQSKPVSTDSLWISWERTGVEGCSEQVPPNRPSFHNRGHSGVLCKEQVHTLESLGFSPVFSLSCWVTLRKALLLSRP